MKLFIFLLLFSYLSCSLIYYQNYEYMNAIKLLDYKGYYGNTKILRYSIPDDVLLAVWRLQFMKPDKCPLTNVFFYLDYSGLPVIQPNNESFPAYYSLGRLTRLYTKQLLVNNKYEAYINISSPAAGNWYSSAFIDNSNNKDIKPDLFRSNCSTYLSVSVNLWRINDTQIIKPNESYTFTNSTQFRLFKFLTNPYFNNNGVQVSFAFNNNNDNNDGSIYQSIILLRRAAFPDLTDFSMNDYYKNCNSTEANCGLDLQHPLISTWYYIAIRSDCNYTIQLKQLECQNCQVPIETFRFVGPSYFLAKYYFNSINNNRSNTMLLNDDKIYFIELLSDLSNYGGTMYLYLINNLVKVSSSIAMASAAATAADTNTTLFVNETVVDSSGANNSQKQQQLPQIILRGCFLFESMNYKKCPDGYHITAATDAHNEIHNTMLNVPYPMIGKWYLALWKECVDRETNKTVTCPQSHAIYSIIQLSSDQCGNDYCGDFGTCYISSQQNIFSACRCSSGYTGYGCTDNRNALSKSSLMISLITLTTSNFLFILPICVAVYRHLYIEALIYFYNMFFSTFYHACDQEYYSFCIFNYDGLQLADFISSYTSFTITVLSMSLFSRKWKVFTFFVGLLSCLSINLYDRFNSITFIVALLVSISVTISTWIKVCYRERKLYPHKMHILKYYVPGILFAATGLVIYTSLQTKSNYYMLHSIWHICMAISIVFFLPDRTSTKSNKKLKKVTTMSSQTAAGVGCGSSINNLTRTTIASSSSSSNNHSPSSANGEYEIILSHVNTSSSMCNSETETNVIIMNTNEEEDEDEANEDQKINLTS